MNMSMQTFIKEYRQNPVDKIPIPVIGMQVWDSVRKKLWNWWWCWWSIYNENACLSVSLCDSLCVWLHMSFSFLTPTKNHENQPRIVSLAISTGLPVAAASEGPQERTSFLLLEFSPWPLRLWRQSCKGMQGKSSLQTALISSNFNSLSSHVNSFKINLKFLTWVIIWLASSIYISIYNFWPYVICHHQNQCFTYASIFSWYLIPLFSKQPNRSSMRSQERMALFVSWTSHLQGGIDIFHQKKNILFWSFQGQWLQIHGIRHVSRFPDSLWLDGDVQQACLSPAANCCFTGLIFSWPRLEGRLSTFLATWPWLDLMIVRNGGTTFAS